MAKQEAPLLQLKSYLPEGSFDDVLYYLQHYKVHLTITRKRESVLGDYRHAHAGQTHRISVNGNLNSYSFLITLLHELAHLREVGDIKQVPSQLADRHGQTPIPGCQRTGSSHNSILLPSGSASCATRHGGAETPSITTGPT